MKTCREYFEQLDNKEYSDYLLANCTSLDIEAKSVFHAANMNSANIRAMLKKRGLESYIFSLRKHLEVVVADPLTGLHIKIPYIEIGSGLFKPQFNRRLKLLGIP